MIERKGRHAARAGHLANLLDDCAASLATDEARCLIEAAQLLHGPADIAKVTAMVACGAYESAAYLVLGPDRPFLLSRGPTGLCLASTLAGHSDRWPDGDEVIAEGATPALAMLGALAAALLADEDQAGSRSLSHVATSLVRFH